MKSFLSWILLEKVNSSQIQWQHKKPSEWIGFFSIGKTRFTLEFWNYASRDKKGTWEVMFQQVNDQGYLRMSDQDALGLLDLAQLFQTIEEGIIELLETNPDVEQLNIHPEASFHKRLELLGKRGKPSYSVFDPGKFNAYQHLFQYSRLKQMGFFMTREGENLIIKRPA